MTDDLSGKLRRIEALRSENEEDPHPSFVRIEAEEARERLAAVKGTITFAENGPSLNSMFIPFYVLFAFALGAFLAYWSTL